MRPLGTVSVLVGIASGLWACGGGSPGGSSASPPPQASPAATATAEISTSAGTAINPGYGGYNLAMVWYGVSYRDANFRAAAAALSAGWLRFPAGTGSLAFELIKPITAQGAAAARPYLPVFASAGTAKPRSRISAAMPGSRPRKAR